MAIPFLGEDVERHSRSRDESSRPVADDGLSRDVLEHLFRRADRFAELVGRQLRDATVIGAVRAIS